MSIRIRLTVLLLQSHPFQVLFADLLIVCQDNLLFILINSVILIVLFLRDKILLQ